MLRHNVFNPGGWPAWVWLIGLLLVLLIRFPIKFMLDPPYLMDFEVYRTVAQRVAHGDARSLYAPTTSDVMLFKYAPCWALLWLPFAWMPAHAGAVVWSVLTVLWLALACQGSVRLCRMIGLRAPGWLPVLAVVLLVRPITAEFLNGQVNLLWGFLMVGFLLAQGSRHPWYAAIGLALAVSLKLPAALVLAYLCVRRRWKLVARTAAVLIVANGAISFVFQPTRPLQLLLDWAHVLSSSGASRAFEIGNQSLLALAARFLTNDGYRLNIANLAPPTVWFVTGLASLGLFLLVCRRPSAPSNDPAHLALDVALLCILMVLCSPTTWIATYSSLILPVTVGSAAAVTMPHATWHDRLAALGAVAAVALSVMTHSTVWKSLGIPSIRGETYVFLVLMIFPWFGLTLFGYLWRQRRRLGQPILPHAAARGTWHS